MAVQDQSLDYQENISNSIKCRDCLAGESRLHEKGREYLPGLSGDSSDRDVRNAYESYLSRALYYNTVSRTRSFLQGMAERTPTIVKFPKNYEYLFDNITGNGESFEDFKSTVLSDVIGVGYGGILVDFDIVPDDVQTKEEAKKAGYRPRLTWYPMESIYNTDLQIRLYEYETVVKDEFTIVQEDRLKVLDLDGEGFYRQRLYKKGEGAKNSNWTQIGKSVYPLMNGKRMVYIPFYPCGAQVNTLTINKPPLLDLVEVSLHHYNVYADYRNGIHFTGFPQLYIAGTADNPKLVMGSGVAWTFEESTATVKYAEFTGKGLEHPEKLLEKLEGYMSKLGARMLMTEKKTAESADKVRQDSNSESSLLASLVLNVASALTKALDTLFEFEGITPNLVVELNTDYDASKIEPSLLVALMKGVQSNFITLETFLYNLKRGEILSQEKSVEEELEELIKAQEEQKKLESKINPLSERNEDGLKDPKDELRDSLREKTEYSLDK